jgi:hypothetical protein
MFSCPFSPSVSLFSSLFFSLLLTSLLFLFFLFFRSLLFLFSQSRTGVHIAGGDTLGRQSHGEVLITRVHIAQKDRIVPEKERVEDEQQRGREDLVVFSSPSPRLFFPAVLMIISLLFSSPSPFGLFSSISTRSRRARACRLLFPMGGQERSL